MKPTSGGFHGQTTYTLDITESPKPKTTAQGVVFREVMAVA